MGTLLTDYLFGGQFLLSSWIANWTSVWHGPQDGVRERGVRGDFCANCLLVCRHAVRAHEESERLPGVILAMKTSRLEQICEVCGAATELELDSGYVPIRVGTGWTIQRLVRETNAQLLSPEKSAEIFAQIQGTETKAHRLAMLTSCGFRINDQLIDWMRQRQLVWWWLFIKGTLMTFALVWLLGVWLGVASGMMLLAVGGVVTAHQYRRKVRSEIWPRFQRFLNATELDSRLVADFFKDRYATLKFVSREFDRYLRAKASTDGNASPGRQSFETGVDFFRPRV